jgi:hypothetical protein
LGHRSQRALRRDFDLRQDVSATSDEACRNFAALATLRRNWVEVTKAMDALRAPDMLKVDLSDRPRCRQEPAAPSGAAVPV